MDYHNNFGAVLDNISSQFEVEAVNGRVGVVLHNCPDLCASEAPAAHWV